MTPHPITASSTSRPFPKLSWPSRPAIVAAVGIGLLVLLTYFAAGALPIFVVALVLAVILDPVVTRLASRGLHRAIAAALVVVALTIGTAVVGLAIGVSVAKEAVAFLTAIPEWISRALAWYAEAPMPAPLRQVTDALLTDGAQKLSNADLAGAALDFATSTLGVLGVTFGLLPFLLFFLLSDRPRTVRALTRAIPTPWRGDVVTVARLALGSISNYLRGEAILMGALAALTWLGLQGIAIGVDPGIAEFALFLTVVAALSELIPMLGPWIATAPAMVFALTVSPEAALAVAALYLVIAIIEGQVLVPLVQGRQFDIHPAAVGVALMIGAAATGLIGAIVALPALAAGLDIFRYVFRRSTGELAAPELELWASTGER